MTGLRTTHSLLGLTVSVLLLASFSTVLRELLSGVGPSVLSLVIPFLAFAATLAALTSAATALTLEVAALILLGLAMAEDGASAMRLGGAAGLVVLGGLSFALLRLSPDSSD